MCAARVTGRDLDLVKVEVSQRELDAIDTYTATMRELAKTSNDTAMISYLAARKVCRCLAVAPMSSSPGGNFFFF
jgi:hypothetical protein